MTGSNSIERAQFDAEERFRASRLVGGALLLLLGGLLTLQSAGVVHVGRLGDFWPLLLVWIGLSRILGPGGSRHFVSGSLLLALGLFFQAERLRIVSLSMREIWPVFLIVAGIALIAEGLRAREAGGSSTPQPGGPA